MLAKHVVKLMRYLMMLSVTVLVAGCANNKAPGDFCAIAQKPFEWHSDAEIDTTPIRPLRYIEEGAALYVRQCK